MPRRPAPVRALVLGIGLLVTVLTLLTAAGPALADPVGPAQEPSSQAADPAPDSGATFGILPATDGKPDARAQFSYGATPGARLRDAVALKNLGTKPVTLRLYATDAGNNEDGAVIFPAENEARTAVGSWITLDGGDQTVTVAPQSSVVVPFTLSVPAGAPPGDHVGAVLAQLDADAAGADGNRVTLRQRLATRIIMRVSGPLDPQLTMTAFRTSYDGSANPVGSGRVHATWTITNTGNVALRAEPRLEVSGLLTSGRASAETIEALLPGSSVTVEADVDGIRPTVRLTAKAVVARSAIAGSQLPAQKDLVVSTHAWAIPWSLIITVLLVVALIVGRKAWRKRHPRNRGRHVKKARATPLPTPTPVA